MSDHPRLTSWPVDRYFPPPLQRLQRALEELYMSSHDVTSVSSGSVHGSGHSDPVAASEGRTRRYRHQLRRTLEDVDRLATRATAVFQDEDHRARGRQTRGPKCGECQRGNPIGARFCNGCGVDLREAG